MISEGLLDIEVPEDDEHDLENNIESIDLFHISPGNDNLTNNNPLFPHLSFNSESFSLQNPQPKSPPPAENFVRIHHSHIINKFFVEKYIRGEGGQVVMRNGTVLDVSKRKKTDFLQAIGY